MRSKFKIDPKIRTNIFGMLTEQVKTLIIVPISKSQYNYLITS